MVESWHLVSVALLLAYPLYILLMAGVLRLCGVSKQDTAAWALKQAGRHRFLDLIAAARGPKVLPSVTGDTEKAP